MSQITEPTKIVLDSVARAIMASVVIAFVWAVLFTIGIMTGWFAPWWLWIGLAVIIFMAVANMPDESAKSQGPDDSQPTDRSAELPHAQPLVGQPECNDIQALLLDVEQKYGELNHQPAVVPVGEDRPPEEPGVYVFLLDAQPCYVGRTSNLSRRIRQHWDGFGSAGHLPATMARIDDIPIDEAKHRVKAMKVRWVVVGEAEDHGVRQALLELYAAVQLCTLVSNGERGYNTFQNH